MLRQILELLELVVGLGAFIFFTVFLILTVLALVRNRSALARSFRKIELSIRTVKRSVLFGIFWYVIAFCSIATALEWADMISLESLLLVSFALGVVFGAYFHTAVSEYGAILAGLSTLLILGTDVRALSACGLVMLVGYGVAVPASIGLRGQLTYSVCGVVARLDISDELRSKSPGEVVERIVTALSAVGQRIKVKRKKVAMIGVGEGGVEAIPDVRIEFVVRGPMAKPLSDALTGRLSGADYLPDALGTGVEIFPSALLDCMVTRKISPIVRGVLCWTREGLVLAMLCFERTSTKAYVSKRARAFLADVSRKVLSALRDAGLRLIERIPEHEDVVFVYQWRPYYEGGELKPETRVRGGIRATDLSKLSFAVSVMREQLLVEGITAQLRKMALRKLVASLVSAALSAFGIFKL